MFIDIFLGGHQSNVGSVQDDSPQAARRMNIYGMLPEPSQSVSDGSLVEVVQTLLQDMPDIGQSMAGEWHVASSGHSSVKGADQRNNSKN